jgi:hypothetical protein
MSIVYKVGASKVETIQCATLNGNEMLARKVLDTISIID